MKCSCSNGVNSWIIHKCLHFIPVNINALIDAKALKMLKLLKKCKQFCFLPGFSIIPYFWCNEQPRKAAPAEEPQNTEQPLRTECKAESLILKSFQTSCWTN